MKVVSLLKFTLFSNAILSIVANKPLSSVQVTLRGKKYDIEDVTTVAELQERLSEASGVSSSQQGRILFNGKRLDASESLSTVGVSEGDQLNVVPKAKSKKKSASSASANKRPSSASSTTSSSSSGSPAAAAAGAAGGGSSSSAMKDLLAKSGVDTNQLDEMVKNMGGEGGAPSMEESMEMMSGMMNSPIFKEYMSDPARLEESRQMILNNPMLKGMMAGMPGMEEILNNPDAWREAMQGAASMYQNMDQDEMMQAMMGGAGAAAGAGGMPPGLFDGMGEAAGKPDLAALDELSEGED